MAGIKGGMSQSQMMQEKGRKKSLPSWVKPVISAMFVIPIVLLLLYSTGAWNVALEDGKYVRDSIDDLVSSFCFFSGLAGLMLIHFSWKYLEGPIYLDIKYLKNIPMLAIRIENPLDFSEQVPSTYSRVDESASTSDHTGLHPDEKEMISELTQEEQDSGPSDGEVELTSDETEAVSVQEKNSAKKKKGDSK